MASEDAADTSRLRLETMRELYCSQRDRREQIRNSIATPVAALAFSVFNLSNLAIHFDARELTSPVNLTIAMLAAASILALVAAALLIVSTERNFIYLDPPDLAEMVAAENALREAGSDGEALESGMHNLLAGAYDIIYRSYFARNEQAARDRTRGLRLVLVALMLIAVSLALLPFQAPAEP